nr:dynein heavy chain 1, axonemal-like [Pseudochaenichthys georgianus]
MFPRSGVSFRSEHSLPDAEDLYGYGHSKIGMAGTITFAVRYGTKALPAFTFQVSHEGANLMGFDCFSLQKLLDAGIIERIEIASLWISSLVVVKKKSGGLHPCIDLGADLRQGYLPFGLSSAPRCCQKIMSTIFAGILGVVVFLDNIVVHAVCTLITLCFFRYNNLLAVISQSLGDIVKALKGLVVMSSELELMASSLFINVVPDMWKAKAYPSLKPLASWVSDLIQRINFLQKWICDGIPPVFWISGFFFPQAFLTGTLQNYARRSGISIDTIGFDFEVIEKLASEITEKPDTGCYIHGLFVEGARWDSEAGQITECRPKELYTEMVLIRLIPEPNRKAPTSGVYICPIYKTLTRAGTLSTTGHSTNYVMAVEVPTDQSQRHWIKRGVALICALDY